MPLGSPPLYAGRLLTVRAGIIPNLHEGLKTGAESFGAGGAKVGAGLRVTSQTIQTEQTNSQSKSPIQSGQVAQ